MNPPSRDLAGAIAAHRRLEADLATLTDGQVAGPSLLPDWTVGHVLTHIARNADGFAGMFEAVARGDAAVQYPGGRAQRNADIDAGAGRGADALRDDVATSNARLEAAWASATEEQWGMHGETVIGRVELVELPFRRLRETVVHHADLGLAYTWHDWPSDYVRVELQRMTMQWDSRAPMGLTGLPPEALRVDDHHRLAWLMGRAEIDGLEPAGLMA